MVKVPERTIYRIIPNDRRASRTGKAEHQYNRNSDCCDVYDGRNILAPS